MCPAFVRGACGRHHPKNPTTQAVFDLRRDPADVLNLSEDELVEETKGYMDLILTTLMFTPPLSMNDITKALVAWGVEDKAEFLSVHLRRLDINQFLDQHFENDKVKAHIAFHTSLGGYSTDRKGLMPALKFIGTDKHRDRPAVLGDHYFFVSCLDRFYQSTQLHFSF